MKILFLTPWYPDDKNPNHGIFVRDQVLTLSRDHEIQVISGKIDYSGFSLSSLNRKDTVFRGIRESRLVIKQSLPVFNQVNFFLRACYETLKIANGFKPDVIHGNIGYPGAFWSWCISVLLGRRYILTEHTRITNNFRSVFHKILTIYGLKNASGVIAVSQRHANEMARLVGIKPVVIHNVINFEKFPGVTSAPTGSVFHIGFLGNLETPVKGLDILLRAASKLQKEFRLHIGGKGKLLEQYEKLASDLGIMHRCVFYGAVSHEEVPAFMARLHFFVSASRFETFGIAMVEALACGLPVVASDSGGSREFINRENGLIVPAEDAMKLQEGVTWMMTHYGAFDRHQIRKRVMEEFSSDVFLRKMNSVYSTACSM